MWKQVIPLFVLAVLVGWFMPAQDPVAAPGAADVGAAPRVVPEVAEKKPESLPGEVVLDREGDGHFYAQGSANGADLRFLVDTGASVVALSDADAQKLGLYWHPGELSMVGRGVNGEVMGKPVTLDTLEIGDLKAENVPAVIIPEGLEVSLLGQSFLSRVGQVSIAENRMTLKN
jgi:aspartyl protease family protein